MQHILKNISYPYLFITSDSSADVLDFLTANGTEFTLKVSGNYII